jgi:anti-sigma B factor antagonist
MEERTTHLQVDLLEVGNRAHGAVLRLSGEVDMTTASRLEAAFQELADRRLTEVIVDASTVTFMDSTGLHALVKGKQLIHEVGSNLALVASPQVRRVLELVFREPLFAVRVDTMEQARDALGWTSAQAILPSPAIWSTPLQSL